MKVGIVELFSIKWNILKIEFLGGTLKQNKTKISDLKTSAQVVLEVQPSKIIQKKGNKNNDCLNGKGKLYLFTDYMIF